MKLSDYLRVLFRRKDIVLITAILGGGVGLLAGVPQTPIYQARILVEVRSASQNSRAAGETPDVSSSITNGPDEIEAQIAALQSDLVLGQLRKKYGIDSLPAPFGRFRRWGVALGLVQGRLVSSRERALGMAFNTLRVERSTPARVFQIISDSTDSQIAADFLNDLAQQFKTSQSETSSRAGERLPDGWKKQLDQLKLDLDNFEEKLRMYESPGSAGTLERPNFQSDSDELRRLEMELGRAGTERAATQSRFDRAASATAESLPEVLGDRSLRESQSKLAAMRDELSLLNLKFTPAHYRVRELQDEIDQLQSAYDLKCTDIIKQLAVELENAKRREEAAAQKYAAQTTLMSGRAVKPTDHTMLKNQVAAGRQLNEIPTERVKELEIASMTGQVRIIEPARPPSRPYKPDIYKYAMLGVVGGLCAGILLILCRQSRWLR